MLRLTGPGKIQEVSVPLGSPTTFAARLYNFDIDGDTLKPQHTAWLAEHIVPQLGNPQVQIDLDGEASRSGIGPKGDDTHNIALSRRRVANVVSFLKSKGPVLAQLSSDGSGSSVAKARGEDEKTEDEHFRAVLVIVQQSLARLVPVQFRAVGSFGPFPAGVVPLGFDPGADPPWLMLPTGSHPTVMQVDNGQGLSLVSFRLNSNVPNSGDGIARPLPALSGLPTPVRITRQSQKFRIQPGVAGDAEIRAVDGAGKAHARLAVSVLPPLTVRCAFHYVQNPRYGTRTRKRGDEASFVARLNDIWGPQANINFVGIGNARDLTMTDDLGDAIDSDAKFDAVARHRNPGIQFNVFFVREVNLKPGPDDAEARTTLGPPGDCLFEDELGGDAGADISHEAGHCLTLDHNDPIPTTSDMLMSGSGETNIFLPRVHVLQARRAVRR
jgi:hypothetical protein